MTNVGKRLRSSAVNAEYVRPGSGASRYAARNVGSLEVSENSETFNEGKGSQIVCDWTRSVKREQHVRHDPSSKKLVINRKPKDHRMH